MPIKQVEELGLEVPEQLRKKHLTTGGAVGMGAPTVTWVTDAGSIRSKGPDTRSSVLRASPSCWKLTYSWSRVTWIRLQPRI